jgi:hypothetical protein
MAEPNGAELLATLIELATVAYDVQARLLPIEIDSATTSRIASSSCSKKLPTPPSRAADTRSASRNEKAAPKGGSFRQCAWTLGPKRGHASNSQSPLSALAPGQVSQPLAPSRWHPPQWQTSHRGLRPGKELPHHSVHQPQAYICRRANTRSERRLILLTISFLPVERPYDVSRASIIVK